jgi:hypothetical protein
MRFLYGMFKNDANIKGVIFTNAPAPELEHLPSAVSENYGPLRAGGI